MKLQKSILILILLSILFTLTGCAMNRIENNEIFPDANFSITSYPSLRM